MDNYKIRLLDSIYYSRISEARKYCVKILDKHPEHRTYKFIYNFLEGLKKSNGRYANIATLDWRLYLISSIFSFEAKIKSPSLLIDQYFIDFCTKSISNYDGLNNNNIKENEKYINNINILLGQVTLSETVDYSELYDEINNFKKYLVQKKKKIKTKRLLLIILPILIFLLPLFISTIAYVIFIQ